MDWFIGEIKLLPWNWAPKGWALCQGQLLPIAQYQALFSLLGTQYGGNGVTNFALPDLRGRTPIHMGNGYVIGESSGVETVTLTLSQMPAHMHALNAETENGNVITPIDRVLAAVDPGTPRYESDTGSLVTLQPNSVLPVGGSQPHNNMQPYLVLSYCIATTGLFPSRN